MADFRIAGQTVQVLKVNCEAIHSQTGQFATKWNGFPLYVTTLLLYLKQPNATDIYIYKSKRHICEVVQLENSKPS